MTDANQEPAPVPTGEPAAAATGAPAGAPAGAATGEPTAAPAPTPPDTADQLQHRMQAFGKEAQEAGQRLGREAQVAGDRWSRDPSVLRVADAGARLWGLVLLAVGLWFFAQVTLGLPLPNIAWRDLWPAVLVLIGLFVILRGMTRRR